MAVCLSLSVFMAVMFAFLFLCSHLLGLPFGLSDLMAVGFAFLSVCSQLLCLHSCLCGCLEITILVD